ncbi:putative ribonuclease t2 protein [Botrytis fragariae]|uniref:Ribonuclease T2-like n=1 Tax=Botrytis fragariae TaxID=1964551 RepID=A0A8H6AXJ2_9HELO|nr:putative ribonuclease t2 protein [Botrytis fragariae]KAF5875591.1 putative ribonuclease t2 protein [Botrytis fragariae]
MTSSISKVLLPFVLLAPAARAASLAATPLVCSSPALSCSGSSTNTCCFNTPGGQMVQTQFWDSNPSTGPSNSWTIHGLWPDHCDGTYDSTCDTSREYSSITNILSAAGQTSLLSYMNTYWVSDDSTNEVFWEHEWNKHGTCISTLEPSCYSSYTTGAEVVDFFNVAVDLFKILPTYTWLANAGIVPSTTKTYTSAQIQAAITAGFGYPATIQCTSSSLDEIWYSFEVRGSVATGTFVPITPVGQSGTCPSTGIKYTPKSGSATPTTTAGGGGSTTTTATAPGGTGSFSGSGYLEAYVGSTNNGCLISAGTWYTSGTCATYTATASGTGFTLKSSKGTCGISGSTFSCGAGVSTVFGSSGGYLTYGGSSTFYATATPSGSTQATVYTSSQSVSVKFAWSAI